MEFRRDDLARLSLFGELRTSITKAARRGLAGAWRAPGDGGGTVGIGLTRTRHRLVAYADGRWRSDSVALQEIPATVCRGYSVGVARLPETETPRLARRVLFAFVLTFIFSRAIVFLIMSRRIPLLYLNLRGTHVHHLSYGITLLAVAGGYLLFKRPGAVAARRVALLYGVGLALTYDEFGMWLHLGGSYWQRASVDAVIVVACFLAILAFARSIVRIETRHRWALAVIVFAIVGFGVVLVVAGKEIGKTEGARLRELEISSTP